MASFDLYTIYVLKFNKHNSTLKKGHKATLISNNFCTDSKLGMLPLTVRWMFLGIILTCGDMTSDTVEMNEKQLRDLLESSWSVPRALDALQSLQLLSYTKNEILLNRIEKNIKEKKEKEKNTEPQAVTAKVVQIKKVQEESEFFKTAYSQYLVKSKGPNAAKNFDKQIKTEEDLSQILKAIANYRAHLSQPQNSWRKPKQTFSAFLGTESSGYFWKDWIDAETSQDPFAEHLMAQAERLKGGV